ncbi:MAG TPA: phosphonate C-P lyase system protein PhnL [Spirochaetia bacterium]|nr:phosphonate C-P lyase system protein PhnL [Spirochaetia bacterium]
MTPAMIRCEGLSKTFLMHIRGGTRIEAFRDVSFQLSAGEFLGIRGPSGAGKSSFLRCLYRTYLPSAGAVWYTDSAEVTHDLAAADEHTILGLRRQEIGYISQFFPVIPRVSALDTIANNMVFRGFPREASLERTRELLERLSIPRRLWEMSPSTFSGGEKQRINIIHAIIARPRLLLLDEPTSSLDSATAHEAVLLIRELKEKGTAMIGVFHDTALLSSLSDRVLTMSPARAGETGP